ncbi:hypothetical protein ACS0TY_004823 [Phlomoides rotata]
MENDRLCDLPAAIPSSRPAATGKNEVVIGLDDDLIAIKGLLHGESSKLEIIPQSRYGRNRIPRLYANEFFSNVLASIKKFEDEMSVKVYQSFKGWRYLIVMDDIWSTEAWDDVRNIFPDDNNGSRIITTRLTDVAAYACCGSPLHEMKWSRLSPGVGRHRERDCKRLCRAAPCCCPAWGNPIHVVVKTRASWEEIMKNVNPDVDGQLDRILSLSYTHLPHYLRPCFLFFGGFPEDHNIHVWRLIRLWVAEGFLKHQNRCKSLEEKAEEYLEDLVKRSLVLITSRKSDGKIKSCSLHDLVRDMCIRKAEEEKFVYNGWACSFRKGRTQAPY